MKNTKKTSRPKVGDIFFGEPEFIIGRKKNNDDKVIEVSVEKDKCIKETVENEQILSKGKLFIFPKNVKTDISIIDKNRENASYVVEHIEYKKSLKLIHSVLPESFLIRARRLKNSKYDPKGEIIEFYTCGIHDNIFNGKLEIISKLK